MQTPAGRENLAFSSELKTHEKVSMTLWIQRNQSGPKESVISKAKQAIKIDLKFSESSSERGHAPGAVQSPDRAGPVSNLAPEPLSASSLKLALLDGPEGSWWSSNPTDCGAVETMSTGCPSTRLWASRGHSLLTPSRLPLRTFPNLTRTMS